ncbi:MAG: hypothetical protein OEZ14_11675 [Acidimicrobiia bacterium]|nr:hypothetical protein [Acidimicrobiia bacterium]MDH5521177.1 hypothetical protein [Acidimicrobiia bacterium]
MVFVLLVLAALLVVVVAFVFIGHAVGSTEAMPDQVVIDGHEAIEFCAQALPDAVTASLSYDDLRRLLRLHLEWIQAYHWAPASTDAPPIIFEQFDPLAYVMERCEVIGLDVDPEEAAAVIRAHSDYLQVIGALHIDDPVNVEADLARAPQLGGAEATPLLDADGNDLAVPDPDTPTSAGGDGPSTDE